MGERSGKIVLGLVLLVVGAALLLEQFGIDGGDLLGILIPGVIMVYGGRKITAADSTRGKVWGVFAFLFGLLMLLGKLELLFSCFLALMVLYIGVRLLRRGRQTADAPPSLLERQWAQSVLKEDPLDRWERDLRIRNQ
jgi:lia operon protein LiaI